MNLVQNIRKELWGAINSQFLLIIYKFKKQNLTFFEKSSKIRSGNYKKVGEKMRIRYKPWARPELEASDFYIDNPEEYKEVTEEE